MPETISAPTAMMICELVHGELFARRRVRLYVSFSYSDSLPYLINYKIFGKIQPSAANLSSEDGPADLDLRQGRSIQNNSSLVFEYLGGKTDMGLVRLFETQHDNISKVICTSQGLAQLHYL